MEKPFEEEIKKLKMQKMVKGAFGWKEADEDATHLLISVKDFNAFIKTINAKYEKDIERTKTETQDAVAKAYSKKLKQKLQSNTEELNKQNDSIREDAEEIKREAERTAKKYESTCRNLLRINKERANKERGIKNKKEHSGYLIKDIAEFKLHYSARLNHTKNDTDTAILHKITVQTPFPVLMEEGVVKDLVFKDMAERKMFLIDERYSSYGNCTTKDIVEVLSEYKEKYIDEDRKTMVNAPYRSFEQMELPPTVFDMSLRTNSREGFWEAILTTNFLPKLCKKNYLVKTELEDIEVKGKEEDELPSPMQTITKDQIQILSILE